MQLGFNAKAQRGQPQPKFAKESAEKKRQKDGGKKISCLHFFAPIFLPLFLSLGSPGKGRGMRGRGMTARSCLFRIPLPLIPLSNFVRNERLLGIALQSRKDAKEEREKTAPNPTGTFW